MGARRRPQRVRAILAGSCALLAAVGGCGRERKPVSPSGEYRYGVPGPVDTTPAAVAWESSPTAAPAPPAAAPSPPAGDAPAPAPGPTPPPKREPAPATTPPPPAEAKGYRVAPPTGGAVIRGFCRIQGDPTRPPIEVFKNNEDCGPKQQPTERLVVGAGGALGNCVVSLRGVKAGKDFPPEMRGEDRSFLLDQKACRYRPHVAVLRPGTQVAVQNSDGADHNIHGYFESVSNTKFNFSSAPKSLNTDTASAFLEDVGSYLVKCDIHPWMSATLLVSAHPYHDVTSAEDAGPKKAGEFVLADVPPGTYELTAWHEGMVETPAFSDGKIASYSYSADVRLSQTVSVAAGETKTVPDFTFDAPAPAK